LTLENKKLAIAVCRFCRRRYLTDVLICYFYLVFSYNNILDLVNLFVRRLPAGGTPVQKHRGVIPGIEFLMTCIVLYFIKCICCSIYWTAEALLHMMSLEG